ncbi:MAG: SAM-dependent methyltransferase [Halioglobus sp.]|jgi:SAM-dependent methyltransferase
MDNLTPPTHQELVDIFTGKYGEIADLNWSPALRWKFDHFNPDDIYEALMTKLVTSETSWLDVGCGRNIFPSNPKLSQVLADRAKLLVGVDPDETLNDNPYVHEKLLGTMEDFKDDREFDLVTLRMVAEHVAQPDELMESLNRVTAPGGLALIYTVYKYSPVPFITNLVPFWLHNPAKKILWGTEPEDTFPTCFKMNTQDTLKHLFAKHRYEEKLFMRLDDCRTFSGFKPLAYTELTLQKLLKKMGIQYPEYCLLGVYQKQ